MIFKDINIKELYQLMQKFEIAETTLQDGKTTITVKRSYDSNLLNTKSHQDKAIERVHTVELLQGDNEHNQLEPPEKNQIGSNGKNLTPEIISNNGYHKIVAPLVGTFYRSPSPDASPFVEVGDHVNIGDVVCIVEAMKSMNEIQSDVKGIIKEICLENAQLVEFEQVLFRVEAE